jgi:ribosome-binding protein aMBF1 (putative translation factor)
MAKILEVKYKNKCTGCELCVFEIQRQMEKVGLEGSFIRVFRDVSADSEKITFSIETDPRVHSFDIEAIKSICPGAVFEIVEREDETK